MKLSDMAKVEQHGLTIRNCDFHLKSLSPFTLRIWDGDRGAP